MEWGLVIFVTVMILVQLALPIFLVTLFGVSLWTLHKKFRKAWLTTGVGLCILAVLGYDIPAGLSAFNSLCDRKAGIEAHQAIQDVGSIRYGGRRCHFDCLALLRKFDHVEVKWSPVPSSSQTGALGPQLLRVSLVPAQPETCPDIGAWRRHFYRDSFEDHCLVVEPIESNAARYGLETDSSNDGEVHGYGIGSREVRVLDVETGQTIGEANSFERFGTWSWSKLSVAVNGYGWKECAENEAFGTNTSDAVASLVDRLFPDKELDSSSQETDTRYRTAQPELDETWSFQELR